MHYPSAQTTPLFTGSDVVNLQERRRKNRRPLRSRALIGVPGERVMHGHTVDISATGLCIIIPNRLECGRGCRVFFTALVGGQLIAINCIGKIANCLCVLDGFRVGMRLVITDERERKAIEQLLGEPLQNSLEE